MHLKGKDYVLFISGILSMLRGPSSPLCRVVEYMMPFITSSRMSSTGSLFHNFHCLFPLSPRFAPSPMEAQAKLRKMVAGVWGRDPRVRTAPGVWGSQSRALGGPARARAQGAGWPTVVPVDSPSHWRPQCIDFLACKPWTCRGLRSPGFVSEGKEKTRLAQSLHLGQMA